ncbi:MAG: hypothetical protein K1X79_09075 [Oligoflexia bacterium]|nr:hypothetical protein [Oligoflexia bacterium]
MGQQVRALFPYVVIASFLAFLFVLARNPKEARAISVNISTLGAVSFDDGLACYKGKPGKLKSVTIKGASSKKFIAQKFTTKTKKQFDALAARCKSLSKTETIFVDAKLKKSCRGTSYVATSRTCAKSKKSFKGFRTLKEALLNAGPGDSLLMRAGLYHEGRRATVPGIDLAPLIIQNYQSEVPIIDGGGIRSTGLEIRADNIRVVGLTFRNHVEGVLGTVALSSASKIVLRHLHMAHNASGISISSASSFALVEKNIIHDISGSAVRMTGDRGHNIAYNIIYNAGAVGIEAALGEAVAQNIIHHNVCLWDTVGFSINSSSALFAQNLAFGSVNFGLNGGGGFSAKNNAIVGMSPSIQLDLSNLVTSEGNTAGYLAFSAPSPSSFDQKSTKDIYTALVTSLAQSFAPGTGSPLLNAGVSVGLPLLDLLGVAPNGAPDIGPFEFPGGSSGGGNGGGSGGGGNGATPTAAVSPTPTATPTISATATVTATPTITPTTTPTVELPAPQISPAPSMTLYDTAGFLFTGPNPIQVNVSANTIKPALISVLRGKVLDSQSAPLSGAVISIAGHPEFGSTTSRQSGLFDMAVNGGGDVVVEYRKSGYLPVDRKASTRWQDFSIVEEVIMVPLDPIATNVDLSSITQVEVVRGSLQIDGAGARQATVLVKPGTQATMVFPNGTPQAISNITTRATEYTVGSNGPKSMPGSLPPTSAYTYAVELSIDEALAAGAESVTFNQPLPFYLENYLNFPVGMVVPSGYYDKSKGTWLPSQNGKVIKILSVSGNAAVIDVSGFGFPALPFQLALLGITTDELVSLAALYPVGQELWRIPIQHFTPWDFNWPFGPPPGAESPKQKPPKSDDDNNPDTPCQASGSIVECENQVLRESIPIAGTNFSLNYSSERVPGRTAGRTIKIGLSGATLPPGLLRIDLKVQVAGKEITQSFPAQANQTYTYIWDGKDAYGTSIQGSVIGVVWVGYVYQAVYQTPTQQGQAFQAYSGVPATTNWALQQITLWQRTETQLKNFTPNGYGIGGWSLSPQHTYVSTGKRLYMGDGSHRSVRATSNIIETVAGNGQPQFSGDNGPAVNAGLDPEGFAFGPGGKLYIADHTNHRVRVVGSDGIISTVAGSGNAVNSGDGGLAIQASVKFPFKVQVDRDENVYVTTGDALSAGAVIIRKISKDGIISAFAGNGSTAHSGDGGLATSAALGPVVDIALDPDGNLLILENYGYIRRVTKDGIIRTIAGGGSSQAEGASALATLFPNVVGFAANGCGEIFISSWSPAKVRKIGIDGRVTTFAGTGVAGFSGDGGLATQAQINYWPILTMGRGGLLNIFDLYNGRVRTVSEDGIISTIAGNGAFPTIPFENDGGPATATPIYTTHGNVAPDGRVCESDYAYALGIRCILPPLPGFSESETGIASEDSYLLYKFDNTGRHLQTINTLTGVIVQQFNYNLLGKLTSIVDGNGNATTINYNSSGDPISILAPFGQTTTLETDATGFLSKIKNSLNEEYNFTYSSSGLMSSMRNPRGMLHTFSYSVDGRLIQDYDPAGGSQTLARSDLANGFSVSRTTGLNRSTQYNLTNLTTGIIQRDVTRADGTIIHSTTGTDELYTTTDSAGMTSTMQKGPDPRFGMQSPVDKTFSVSTPSGLTLQGSTVRVAYLTNQLDPLSLSSVTSLITVNGSTFYNYYTAWNKTSVLTSPLGRTITRTFDSLSRVTSLSVLGFDPVNYNYDSFGRLTSVAQGSGPAQRISTLHYNSSGYADALTDPLAHVTGFIYDPVGRVTSETLPNTNVIGFGYDPSGNLTTLSPPGQPSHNFQYTPLEFESAYAPPNVGLANPNTTFTYNIDRQVTSILRPDGASAAFNYNPSSGKLDSETSPAGQLTYQYYPTSGLLHILTAPNSETLTFNYDGSLLTQEIYGGLVSGTINRGYDNFLRTSNLRVNALSQINFGYDNDGLLTSAGAVTLARSPLNGTLSGTTLSATTDTYSYNSFAEVSDYTAKYLSSTLFAEHYNYDKLGRIQDRIETIGAGPPNIYSYIYDANGRLHEVDLNSAPIAVYNYDANGNRLSVVRGTTTNATYDAQDRLLTYGTQSYTYTDNGERLSKTDGAQVTNYNYNVYGSLISAILPNGNTLDYIVDGRDRRVGKKINGTLVQGFLYQDGLRPIAELDGTGAVVSRFVYGSHFNVPDYVIKSTETYRIFSDHLGSPRYVVNASTGAVAEHIDYDEFGNVLTDTNPGFQPFGFGGGIYDQDTKLVRFGARDYDAAVGRWTAKDPIGFGGGDTNLYGYVVGDPINRFDPLGLEDILAGSVFSPENLAKRYAAASGAVKSALIQPGDFAAAGIAALLELGELGSIVGERLGGEVCTKEVFQRKAFGSDGGISKQFIERDATGNAISRTHQVTVDGNIVHQHIVHFGKYGGTRTFPDRWTGIKTINND